MSPNSYAAQNLPLPPPRDEAVTEIPTKAKGAMAARYEPPNMSHRAIVATVQGFIRSAEAGNTRDLFALYRDEILSGSHVQSEFSKRKMPVLSEPHALQPADPENPQDVRASDAVRWMIDECENWLDALTFLSDSTLWPVSVGEKLFAPAPPNELGLRWKLRRIEPINYTLLCLNPFYMSTPEEKWEKDLRIFPVDDEGNIIRDTELAYWLEPIRHVVHRGHLLVGTPDRFGGPMRAVLFWWLLSNLLRDLIGRNMERYGAPFPVIKTDLKEDERVAQLRQALALSVKIGGLVVSEETEVQLIEAAKGDMAGAYETCLNICNREISKVILGQTLSGTADPGGLGSGNADLHGDVREDVKRFDRRKLSETLRQQVFTWFLRINGIQGAPPHIVWGGLSPADAKAQADVLVSLSQASLEPTDEAIPTISERVGFEVQRKAAPAPGPFGGSPVKPFGIQTFSAHMTHPSDLFAAEGAAALAMAFKMDFEEVKVMALSASSPAEFLLKLQRSLPHVPPARILRAAEPILQKCAAAGAAAVPPKTLKS